MNKHRIDDYRFGQITINGKNYHQDVIILPDKIIDHWRRARGHQLQLEDLEVVIEEKPDILVIGRGTYSRMLVPEEINTTCLSHGIKVIALPSKQACERFNELSKEYRLAIAIHLTC